MFVPEQPAERVDTHPAAPPDRIFTGHPVKLSLGSGAFAGSGASAGSRASTFEGPLDLLLFLIARDEIDIFDIPIEHITNEYLQYLGQLESLNIDVCGDFLVMAAQLLEIKSRMLLPQQERPQEEEEEAGDPRAELVARLLEYKRYKRVAEELRARAELQRFVFSRRTLTNGNGNGDAHPVLELSDVSAFDLWAAFQNVLTRVKEPVEGEVVRAPFTVAQKMAAVASRLKWSNEEGIRFEDLFDEAVTRLELVVVFLALLELIRLRRVRVAQERNFGEIRVYPYPTDSQE